MNLGGNPVDTFGVALGLAVLGMIVLVAKGVSGLRKGGLQLDRSDEEYGAMREQSERLAASRAEQQARIDSYVASRNGDGEALYSEAAPGDDPARRIGLNSTPGVRDERH